jgi:hypothetical protein
MLAAGITDGPGTVVSWNFENIDRFEDMSGKLTGTFATFGHFERTLEPPA